MRTLWLIPVYRHARPLAALLDRLAGSGCPVLVVDDGNDPPLKLPEGVDSIRFGRNRGKGAAVMAGLRWAAGRGFTHLVQIDADGQHDLEDARAMVETARSVPDALVTGFPVYDASAPSSRVSGRKVTRLFLWLETGRRDEDGLCGCRVYPVSRSLALLELVRERRMGFDVEFPVRWLWSGWPLVTRRVHVTYPAGGYSNFRMVRDNAAFFLLHARLCFLRLFRLYRRAQEGGEKNETVSI